jgi:GNAT superfamily N-acetyltransferase
MQTDPSPLTTIRAAHPGEADLLREIHRRASYIWPEDRANLDANPQIFGVDHTAVTAGRVRVAVNARDRPVGFATWRPAGGDAELDDLFVEPDMMRLGIGSALVGDAAQCAAGAGLEHLLVVAHPRTRAFYSRAGFVVQGPATTRFGPALRLARDLTPEQSEGDRAARHS